MIWYNYSSDGIVDDKCRLGLRQWYVVLSSTLLKIIKGTVVIFLRCVHWVNLTIFTNVLKQLCRAFYLIIVQTKISAMIELTLYECCITMTSQWAWWRHRSPASRLSTQPFIRAQIKENIKAPRHWPLCGEFTGDRWILRTNGQWRGKCFHLMTSSWDEKTHLFP